MAEDGIFNYPTCRAVYGDISFPTIDRIMIDSALSHLEKSVDIENPLLKNSLRYEGVFFGLNLVF